MCSQRSILPETHQAAVLVALCVIYAVCILPVGISSALLPALEEDTHLGWIPTTSGLYMAATTWAVALGSFAVGWCSDYFPNGLVMLAYVFIAGCILEAMSWAPTASSFIALHLLVFGVKSVTWPAAMSMLGTHLSTMRPELGILLVGLASRLASVGSSVFMGKLLSYMDWRLAVQCIATVLVCAAVTFRLLIKVGGLSRLIEPLPPQHGAAAAAVTDAEVVPEAGNNSTPRPSGGLGAVTAYCLALFKDHTFQLLICYGVGLELAISFNIFVGAFMHAIYRESISDSAIWSGTMNMGEVASIGLGILLVFLGTRRDAIFAVVQIQLVIGILVSATIVFLDVSFSLFFTLGMVLGFASTLGGYLIVPLHCIELAKISATADIATRVTIIDGLATFVGATCRFFVGLVRNADESRGLLVAAIFSLVGTTAMATSLYFLSRRPLGESVADRGPRPG